MREPSIHVLAIDSASSLPAVALHCAGRLLEERLPDDRRASEELLPAIVRLLAAADVFLSDCGRIAVCAGPGSFTGVRVGMATAWGLGRALALPVESLSTLEALAEAARAPGLAGVTAVLDAGRGEVVLQQFLFPENAPRVQMVGDPERLPLALAADRLRGGDVAALPEDLLGSSRRPLARSPAAAAALAVARAPRAVPAAAPAAIYARPSAAEDKLGAP
ncbi:MAG TPA: tRNA (adenosine(37)-N6)-threonylcarbamoyltransferase complex dimerization subunit type 1 TsaB [Thermoanaerobaculia bacterium]|nr:tRNA (adenosine(37)-N6)-threonylcarbamoyltransferase complex dimerization subunit type 1 TsaB [Thermoanaerobaculia bacterium]